MKIEKVLAIESSCDDTSVAIVQKDGQVIKVLSAAQIQAHSPFGGVVPEIASRNHSIKILPLIDAVLKESHLNKDDIDGIAVTSEPGLIGALLVGVVVAKSLALAWDKPFIGVNHLEGHIWAPFLSDNKYQPPKMNLPFLSLAVSGGHTTLYKVSGNFEYETLGTTIDDAAGEAFDKLAKLLHLGFPGGIYVDKLSKKGDLTKYPFPIGLNKKTDTNFSFSGLKTSAINLIQKLDIENESTKADICASYQEAIVDALMLKLIRQSEKLQIKNVTITGGVSANSRLREKAGEWASKNNITLGIPPLRYCTDNAAMIGFAGIRRMNNGEFSNHSLTPQPRASL